MNVAVTTASGQLGSAIIKQLKQEPGTDKIVGIARTPSKAEHLGIEIRKGDYNSQADFELALQDIEVVMIVSGMDAPEKRIGQHRNIINAAREAGVRKLVYSSIIGVEGDSSFDAIVNSNRQTEQDIRDSGLDWAIGRNGLYIEPDVEYMDTYLQDGKVSNCAGKGLCSYTTRPELAFAYAQMLLNDDRNEQVYNLTGNPITQQQLTAYLNNTFGSSLDYEEISPQAYLAFQKEVNGEFLGSIIAGIYTKIRNGEFDVPSHFKEAAGRAHQSWDEYFKSIKGQAG